MDIPGLSIFQGGDSIKLNNSINRAEEEEALEDQRRRNEELGDQLQNAFDDLIEEDELTVDLSANYQNQYPQIIGQHANGGSNSSKANKLETEQRFAYNKLLEARSAGSHHNDHKECRLEVDKLQKCLESKTREIEALTKLLHDEKKKGEDNKKRLALAEAEKERAQMTASKTHELLVDSKVKISEMEASMADLNSNVEAMKTKNKELVAELECTKLQLSDAQHKYRIIERNASYSADARAENLVKEANERHLAQVTLLQQQIENLRGKLDVKDREYSTLDVRFKELQKNREALLSEKSELMTQLARNMDEAQRHYQELVAKQGMSQENERLQRFVGQLETQIETMQKHNSDLRARLDATAAELNLMEELVEENAEISHNMRRLGITKESFNKSHSSSSVNDRIIRLKDELYRCLVGQKEKREEIRKLQDQISKQNEEINQLRVNENDALIKMTTANEENARLSNRLRLVEAEMDELRTVSRKGDALAEDLLYKLDKMKNESMAAAEEIAKVRNECEAIKGKNKELQIEVQTLLEKLDSKKESDKLIVTLKEKARKFEEYIKNSNSSSQTDSERSSKLQERGVSTSPELNSENIERSVRIRLEANIRNDMAKIFANKIKHIEEVFVEKYQEMEEHNGQLRKDIHSIYTELQTRENEVDLLKRAILMEREKMQEILESKSAQLHEVNSILEKCRNELKYKQDRIDQIQQELDERSSLIDSERLSMKAVMSRWSDQQQDCRRTNKELEEKLRRMHEQHRESLEKMQTKYNAAKKTAANYKRYAEDKEKHMLQEYDRIKTGYDEALKKLEEQMKRTLEKQSKHMRDKTKTKDVEAIQSSKNPSL